ncbi:MAG TPA: DUF3570 domain-containing protein [Polyangia bacterium]|nr:DUF3570 domain-containing protein [Polyangia bacterium]
MKRLGFFLLVAGGALLPGTIVRGDEVTIRGAYYREPSTRVIQPVVEMSKDLPHGFDVETHYLLDAISSASAAAGPVGDSVFTEIRNEVGIGVGKTWDRTRATLGYRYSAESDYWSHGVAGSVAQRLWGDTATVALSLGLSFDSMSAHARTPDCATPPDTSCFLNSYFYGLSYTQVLSPVQIAQVNLEGAFLDGFQGNIYRMVPNFGYEKPPDRRMRNAVAARWAYYLPESQTGFQIHYRFYWDFFPGTSQVTYNPWDIRAHTIEGRFYQRVSRTLEIRLLYRQYVQNHAAFWCDSVANPSCYDINALGLPIVPPPPYQSSDPKLGPVYTEYPEVKLIWDADPLHDIPFFRWFSTGTFEISYGHYYQNTSFGNAHVLQTGYSMPY